MKYKLLCVGPQFRGSNASGLFNAFVRLGHVVSILDEFYYLPLIGNDVKVRMLNKLVRKLYIKEFNEAIKLEANKFKPDFVIIYKGAFVFPSTIRYIKENCKIFNFYPDVSFHTHGSLLKRSLPFFDYIFTTKTFGVDDLKEQFGIINSSFIPHGFDPDVHNIKAKSLIDRSDFRCDVSFIGTWSPKKEQLLSKLKINLSDIDLKIWGNQWEKASSPFLKSSIQGCAVEGDLYCLAIQASKINLGILSEKIKGAKSGDLITSRTFHIPGAGGFMLHERNEESVNYFIENKEAVFFDGIEELIDRIQFYLENEKERKRIAERGHRRAQRCHSLDMRAKSILQKIEKFLF